MQVILLLISALFLFFYSLLLFYYRQGWMKLKSYEKSVSQKPLHTNISIIIPARNEGKNIGALIQSILNQSYPAHLFELIIIDDHSSDNTVAIVKGFTSPVIKLISLENELSGEKINAYKKKAIELGIASAKGDLILTTDADCLVPTQWLETIASFYETNRPTMIVMPVAINYKYRFIEIFQALDFMTLQGITGASVHKKFHSMCNGANLAYNKKTFREVNGFENIDHIASGDDMLLMHKFIVYSPDRVLYLKSTDVIVKTKAIEDVRSFFYQRIRWASKATVYNDKSLFPVLLLVYLFNLFLLGLIVAVFFENTLFPFAQFHLTMAGWIGIILGSKTIVELFFLYPVARFYKSISLLWFFPLMQPFHILYTIIAGWLGKFGRYKWKARIVH